jgi:hypothetical protein
MASQETGCGMTGQGGADPLLEQHARRSRAAISVHEMLGIGETDVFHVQSRKWTLGLQRLTTEMKDRGMHVS